MKKWLSLLLAGLMILTMAVSAMAASPVYTDKGHDHTGNGYYIIPIIDASKGYYYPTTTATAICPKCGEKCYPVYADSSYTYFLGYYCKNDGVVVPTFDYGTTNKAYCSKCGKELTPIYDKDGKFLYYYCLTHGEYATPIDYKDENKAYCKDCGQILIPIYDNNGKFLYYYCTIHGIKATPSDAKDDTKAYCNKCGSLLTPKFDAKTGMFLYYYCPVHGNNATPIDYKDTSKVYCPYKTASGKYCNQPCEFKYYNDKGEFKPGYYCPTHGYVTGSYPAIGSQYTISLYAGYGGSMSIDGSNPVKAGENRTITITPDYGYDIAAVYVNGYYYGVGETVRLENINRDYSVQVKFRKVDTRILYTIDATTVGNGSVYATVNGKSVGVITKLSVSYADTVVLRFVPGKGNYTVAGVTVNGVSQGAISTLTLKRANQNVSISAKFQWNNPYSDVNSHLAAVEYVTEMGIMGSPNTRFDTDKFVGNSTVSLRAFACYLAELADVNDKLDTVSDRITWAKNTGIITDADDLTKSMTAKEAAALVEIYVRYLEKTNNIVFTDLKNVTGAQNVATTIGFLSATQYQNNNLITRYDMAEICYGIYLLD